MENFEMVPPVAGESFETAMERFVTNAKNYRKASVIAQAGREAAEGHMASSWMMYLSPGGKKYIRVCAGKDGQGSAFCFVERETGNVFKPAGWKSPAKHARGSIFSSEFKGYGITEYGAEYIVR